MIYILTTISVVCFVTASMAQVSTTSTTTPETTTTTIPKEGCICGDPLFDGEMHPTDALLVLMCLTGESDPKVCVPSCCDVDGEEPVTITDAIWLLESSVKLRPVDSFNCPDPTTTTSTTTTLTAITTTTTEKCNDTTTTTSTTLPPIKLTTTTTCEDTTTTSTTSTSTSTTSTTNPFPEFLELTLVDSPDLIGALGVRIDFSEVAGMSIASSDDFSYDCESAEGIYVVSKNEDLSLSFGIITLTGLSVIDNPILKCPVTFESGSIPTLAGITLTITDISDINANPISGASFSLDFN